MLARLIGFGLLGIAWRGGEKEPIPELPCDDLNGDGTTAAGASDAGGGWGSATIGGRFGAGDVFTSAARFGVTFPGARRWSCCCAIGCEELLLEDGRSFGVSTFGCATRASIDVPGFVAEAALLVEPFGVAAVGPVAFVVTPLGVSFGVPTGVSPRRAVGVWPPSNS